MGASAVLTPTIETADMNKAFAEIRRVALHEYGHGGYTGSIAEKTEAKPAATSAMTADDAVQLANRLLFDDDSEFGDKYGPAGAIPIKASNRHRKTIGWMFFGWCAE